VNILAECGIALIYTPYLTQTYINGASRWLSPTRALIQLSTRHKSNDALWFTLMHELGHILKHGKKDEFIDFASQSSDTQEAEADSYALETLIPANEYKSFVMQQDFSKENIVRASNIMGIGSDILAGRLAHDNFINWALKQQLSIKIELKKPVKA
jgi:HTH-type transcriptional regulator/antitoxin HigA